MFSSKHRRHAVTISSGIPREISKNASVGWGSIVNIFCVFIVIRARPDVLPLIWLMSFSGRIFFFQSTSVRPEARETQVGDSSGFIASFWVISNVTHLCLRML